jgi:hypothetical protein
VPHPLGELGEEAGRVWVRVVDDLPGQETVLGCDVAFDVDEADDPFRLLVGEQQRGEATHRVPDDVEPVDAHRGEHGRRGGDQERDRDGRQVCTRRLAAARRVVGDKWPSGQRRVEGGVGVVLLGAAEAVQEHDRRPLPGP